MKPVDFPRKLLWVGTPKLDILNRIHIPVRASRAVHLEPGDQVDVFYDTENNALIIRATALRGEREAA